MAVSPRNIIHYKRLLNYINQKNIFLIALFIIITAGIYLRTKLYLFNYSLWYDEFSIAYNIVSKNFSDYFAPLECDVPTVAPPFFMIISKFILIVSGQSNNIVERDLIIRLFPFICSVCSLPLFAYLSYKLFNNKFLTLVSTSIISFSSICISYSAQCKQYSAEMIVSIILLIAFYSININFDSFKKIILYSILFCLAPWFSFSSFFILAGGFTSILVQFIKEKFINKTKFLFIILSFTINLFLYYFLFLKNILHKKYGYLSDFWKSEAYHGFFKINTFIPLLQEHMNELNNSYTTNILPLFSQMNIIFFILLNLLVLFSYKNYKRIILIILPVFLCIIFAFANLYPFRQRLLLFLIPIITIIYSQFTLLLKEKKITLFVIIIIIFSLFQKYSIVDYSFKFRQVNHTRDLFIILKEENPNFENIFILEGDDGFKYYTNSSKIGSIKDLIEHRIKKDEEYWFYTYGCCVELNDYLLSNKNINVLKLYNYPKKPEYAEYDYKECESIVKFSLKS